jgi:hypothetical protein
MVGQDRVAQAAQRTVVRDRLLVVEHIERRAENLSGFQRSGQRRNVDRRRVRY